MVYDNSQLLSTEIVKCAIHTVTVIILGKLYSQCEM